MDYLRRDAQKDRKKFGMSPYISKEEFIAMRGDERTAPNTAAPSGLASKVVSANTSQFLLSRGATPLPEEDDPQLTTEFSEEERL